MTKAEIGSAIGALEKWGRTVDNWVLICAAFVALFLAAEVVFSVLHWRNEKRLRPLRAEQAQIHEMELADLAKVAAEANARAADANEKAEQERLARVKIEARLAPRSLPQAQQHELAVKISGFADRRGTIQASPSNPESEMFVRVLAAALMEGGWHVTPIPGSVTTTYIFPTGVIVAYPLPATGAPLKTDADAAEGLASGLREFGIDATAIPGPIEAPNNVIITVSTK